eukprot:1731335-Prymnesium_polylepis.1
MERGKMPGWPGKRSPRPSDHGRRLGPRREYLPRFREGGRNRHRGRPGRHVVLPPFSALSNVSVCDTH